MLKISKIWNDPVVASVVATSIISGATWIYEVISSNSFVGLKKFFTRTVDFPFILILIPWTLISFFLAVLTINKIRDKKPIEEEGDVVAILNSWWPKSEGFPPDVSVNFKELEASHNVKSGLVKKHIDQVAKYQGFHKVAGGENYSIYSYKI